MRLQTLDRLGDETVDHGFEGRLRIGAGGARLGIGRTLAVGRGAPIEDAPRVRDLGRAGEPLGIGPHELDAELCTTITQVATGMMHRKGVGTNDAMFFVFAIGQQRSFYMKNVDFPIAAAYIDTDGVVQEIVQLKAREVTPVPSQSERIQYVLETAPDWFTRNNVGVGALVTTPKGELRTTLARLARLP